MHEHHVVLPAQAVSVGEVVVRSTPVDANGPAPAITRGSDREGAVVDARAGRAPTAVI